MSNGDDQESLLRSVALRNAQAILAARQRSEEELLQAKQALELRSNELAHSLAASRATLEATTDGILVTDDEGNVTDFNDRFLAFWKIPSADMADRRFHQVLDLNAAQFDNPSAFLDRVSAISASSSPESFDVLHLRDGRICERYSRLQIVDGHDVGRVWTFRDVTEQRRVEYALREEGRILELLNTTGKALASELNLEALLQQITDAATELSGAKVGAFFYNEAQAEGEVLKLYTLSGAHASAFSQFQTARVTGLFATTFHGGPPVRSDDILRDVRYGKREPHGGMPLGHILVRSYLAVPVISRSGEVIGGLFFGHPLPHVFTDRSERLVVGVAAQAAVAIDNARLYEKARNAANERASLLESERNARQLAEEQNRSKDNFLAMLGHELRNPLSAISASVAVIQAVGPSSSRAVRAFDIIERQSGHLERIVNDLLDAGRMLAGKITLKKNRVDLAGAVNACLRALEAVQRTTGHTIHTALTPAMLDADPARIDQIVNNLIINALKYTPPGGEVWIRVVTEGTQAVLEVSDNGIGMSAELLGHVFDPFVQGERALDRSDGGLGIGLTVVRKLTELHGGSITVTSRGEGSGSTFTIRFPLAADGLSQGDVLPVPLTHCNGYPSVLVIEDNPDALEMTSDMLALHGYHVLRAGSGMQGLAIARAELPDIAVVDIGLPDITGFDLAERLRADVQTREIRLIALTGYGAPEDVRRALAAGFEVHLVKPVNFERLVATVGLSITAK